jgi:hypothetical protein
MPRCALPVVLAIASVVLAACQVHTDPATDVAETSATLNARGPCSDVPDDLKNGELLFQYQRIGTSTWSDGPPHRFVCREPVPDLALSDTINGLQPDRAYRFRLALDLDGGEAGDEVDLWVDGDGRRNGTRYDTFSTLPALAIPQGGASGFAQAADFYDSVGVNTHFWALDTQYNPSWSATAFGPALDRLAELGVRHIRDATVGSWYDWRFFAMRPAYLALNARNRNLPGGEQPIFLMGGTDDWTTRWSGPVKWTIDDWFPIFDGGHQHYNGDPRVPPGGGNVPGVGAPVPSGKTGPGTIPTPWAASEPEIPWELMDALQGPNEPRGTPDQLRQLKPWMAEMTAEKRARSSSAVLGGRPYVTETGVQPGPAHADQLPTVGVALPPPNDWSALGDWSDGTGVVDVGDVHVYWGGQEPTLEGYVSQLDKADSYNGDLKTPPDRSKALPMIISETGYISRGTSGALVDAHSGFWPAPDDVIAEYLVRSLLMAYRLGFRRTYVYELMDQRNDPNDAEQNFGLVRHDGLPKPQFYAIKNLLEIVGFTEAPAEVRRPIDVSVSGFAPGPSNRHTVAFGPAAGPFMWDAYSESTDRLDSLLLQQSANTYLYFVWRQTSLWDREPGNRNPLTGAMENLADPSAGRKTPDTQKLQVHLPPAVASVSVAQPTAGGAASPEAGRTFSPLAIRDNTVPLEIAGKAKVLKIVMEESTVG